MYNIMVKLLNQTRVWFKTAYYAAVKRLHFAGFTAMTASTRIFIRYTV
jgi:hypothetical protein